MGILIVLDGVGGVGKSTQKELLLERLIDEYGERRVHSIDFPRYGSQPYGAMIRGYLDGALGDPREVSPYYAGMLYALDRAAAAPALRKLLHHDSIVVATRYIGSNLAYQGAKFSQETDLARYIAWQEDLEYRQLKVVRETVTIILHAPAEVSQAKIDQRLATDVMAGRDGHERETDHVQKIVDTYLQIARSKSDWYPIDCLNHTTNTLQEVESISDIVWQLVQRILPK